nr:lasso peptide biosynthesis B2 protein [Desulfosporosinus sp. I2]
MKYFRLPWSERILLLSTFMLLGFVRLALLIIPFRYLSACLDKHMAKPYNTENTDGFKRRISWAIDLMSRYTPWESKCLVQAITGKLFLRQRRIENTLYLGVAKTQEESLIAHAWLRSGDDIVTGVCGNKEFTVVAKFIDYNT